MLRNKMMMTNMTNKLCKNKIVKLILIFSGVEEIIRKWLQADLNVQKDHLES